MTTKRRRTQPNDPIDGTHAYGGLLWKAQEQDRARHRPRLMIGIPMTGLVRSEWMLCRYGQITPTNWAGNEVVQWMNTAAPIGFAVAEARNLLVKAAVEQNVDWLFFLDHDVMLPPDTFIKLNAYMRDGRYPIVAGIYWTKSFPAEPIIYRGRGTSYVTGWKMGERVWCDGSHMGCTLLSGKLLRAMYTDAAEYTIGGLTVRKVFETPYGSYHDPNTGERVGMLAGTEDLAFFDRMLAGEYLKKAGFEAIGKKRWPILCDTTIACLHIREDGATFPLGGLPAPGTRIT